MNGTVVADNADNNSIDNSPIWKLLKWIADVGIQGLGILPPAEKVAADHLKTTGNIEAAIESVIAWRTAYASGTGFATGLGGVVMLPVAIPASLATSYALGANTAAAIACLRGYDTKSDQVRTMVLGCLLGESIEEVLRTAGIQVGTKLAKNVINQIPGKVLIQINKAVGFRLVTKAGEKGVINFIKLVPLVGGVVGTGFDGFFVNTCGHTAKRVFSAIRKSISAGED